MPRINVLANIARSTLLIALCTIGAACVYRTRHTTEEVQTAIRNAGIIGKEPEQVGDLLRNIRLRNNDSISVSSYEPEYFRIEAAVSPARRTWWTRWQNRRDRFIRLYEESDGGEGRLHSDQPAVEGTSTYG